MANEKGFIDPLSSTWSGVKGWAASELLETYVKGEKADDVKAVELKARSKVLRELMDIANPKKQKKNPLKNSHLIILPCFWRHPHPFRFLIFRKVWPISTTLLGSLVDF